MADTVYSFVTGDAALHAAMAKLPVGVQKGILRKATRKTTKPVQASARAWAPHDTGDLEASIRVRALKRSRKNKDIVGSRVVTSQYDSLYKGDQFYGAFQEFGTKYMEDRKSVV